MQRVWDLLAVLAAHGRCSRYDRSRAHRNRKRLRRPGVEYDKKLRVGIRYGSVLVVCLLRFVDTTVDEQPQMLLWCCIITGAAGTILMRQHVVCGRRTEESGRAAPYWRSGRCSFERAPSLCSVIRHVPCVCRLRRTFKLHGGWSTFWRSDHEPRVRFGQCTPARSHAAKDPANRPSTWGQARMHGTWMHPTHVRRGVFHCVVPSGGAVMKCSAR